MALKRKVSVLNGNEPPKKKQKINDDIILKTLKTRFGFDSFRDNQYKCITNILNGNDIICLLPTGHGKSLIMQLPPLITNKLGIIISPLQSLMKNHVVKC